MGCERFAELLPDYLECELPPAALATVEAHRLDCASCAALAADLEEIRDAAATLPALEPSRDLWAGIEARIAAPVVSLDEARPAHAAHAAGGAAVHVHRGPVSWTRRPWLAAAAALLLVAGTAGVTYTLTASRFGGGAPLAATDAPAGDVATLPTVVAAAPTEDAAPAPAVVPSGSPAGDRAPAAPRPARSGGATLVSAATPPVSEFEAAAAVYDAEIAVLRGMLDQRATGLDTATVRVLETNIGIIDRAIRESREALLRDPASPMLNRRLNDALGEKLDLMRTAVLISSGDD